MPAGNSSILSWFIRDSNGAPSSHIKTDSPGVPLMSGVGVGTLVNWSNVAWTSGAVAYLL